MFFGSMVNMPEKALFIKTSRWDYIYTHGPNYIQKKAGANLPDLFLYYLRQKEGMNKASTVYSSSLPSSMMKQRKYFPASGKKL